MLGSSPGASVVWPAANRAIYCPIYVQDAILVTRIACCNGATLGGNIDLGIYTEWGSKLVSTGSVAQAGISVPQSQDITDTLLMPGTYYLALASNSATATFMASTFSTHLQLCRTFGFRDQAAAFALPATATFASSLTSAYVPWISPAYLAVQ